jgi:hypothetical protein
VKGKVQVPPRRRALASAEASYKESFLDGSPHPSSGHPLSHLQVSTDFRTGQDPCATGVFQSQHFGFGCDRFDVIAEPFLGEMAGDGFEPIIMEFGFELGGEEAVLPLHAREYGRDAGESEVVLEPGAEPLASGRENRRVEPNPGATWASQSRQGIGRTLTGICR